MELVDSNRTWVLKCQSTFEMKEWYNTLRSISSELGARLLFTGEELKNKEEFLVSESNYVVVSAGNGKESLQDSKPKG
jgi:hypothetical protein